MFVKICGITTAADAVLAAEAGADAVGFVFWDLSPRAADSSVVAGFAPALPPELLTVAVFRDESPRRVLEVVATTGVGAAQVHGLPPPDVERLRQEIPFLIEAVPAGPGLLDRLERSPADLVLADAPIPGSGRPFDWSLLDGVPTARLLLAGGLTPGNVAQAVERAGPFGVDVASGVEASPGRKDPQKVRSFIRAARRAAGAS